MAGQLTIDTLKASSGSLATQNGMTGICKAWVNFVGNTGTINGSFNVSSITYGGSGGPYTVNFTTALPSANFAPIVSGQENVSGGINTYYVQSGSLTTTSFQWYTYRLAGGGAGFVDVKQGYVAVFSS